MTSRRSLMNRKNQKDSIINEYAASNKVVHQLIDLALLQNNMLKGASSDKLRKSVVLT